MWQVVDAAYKAYEICHFVGLEKRKKRKITAILWVFYEKRRLKNRRSEPQKLTKDPPLAILVFFIWIFLALWDFFENFWIAPKGRPSILQQWMLRQHREPSFYVFRHCDAVQNFLNFRFFLKNFFMSPKHPPSFSHILQQTGFPKSPKGLFTILKTLRILIFRYSADFDRSRLFLKNQVKVYTLSSSKLLKTKLLCQLLKQDL